MSELRRQSLRLKPTSGPQGRLRPQWVNAWPHGAASWSVAFPASHLASALLRLQPMDRTQADRETTLHAPQSGSAWIGGVARAVALEQFPLVSLRRGRAGAHQRYRHFADASSRTGGLRIAAKWWVPGPRKTGETRGTPAPPGLACGEDIFLARDPGHPRWEEQVKACRAMERT